MSDGGYTYWREALKGNFLPVHEGDAQPGFYRRRMSRGGAFTSVAIWEQDGELVALVDGKPASPAEVWGYCCEHPVTEEAYRQHLSLGTWPDDDSGVTASLAAPGHNSPPKDEAEILSDQIDAASKNAEAYVEIKDDETAAKAQGVRARLLELSGEAEKKHKVEKAPALEEGRRIDKRWFGLRDRAKEAADAIRKALSAHETRKAQEAEDRRIKAEREAVKAAAKGRPAPPPPEPEPVQTQIKAAYGRAASVRIVKIAKIVNADAFAAWPATKSHAEYIELLAKLAQRAVNAGFSPPGIEITEERQVI